MRNFTYFAFLCALGMSAACADLEAIPPGTCGNAVLDPGEDCDTFAAAGGTACRAPGKENECRFDCSADPESCPTGYRCGTDLICRAANGTFTATGEGLEEAITSIRIGDFNGDGRKDVFTVSSAEQRIHYYDYNGTLSEKLSIPGFNPNVSVGPLTSDATDDFTIAANYGLGVMRGQSDGTVSPTQYAFVAPPENSRYVLIAMDAASTFSGDETLLLFDAGSGTATLATVVGDGEPVPITQMPGKIDGLAGIAHGHLFNNTPEKACEELVIAYQGDSRFLIYSPCEAALDNLLAPKEVTLGTSMVVWKGVHVADMNGDALQDIVIGGIGFNESDGQKKPYCGVGVAYNTGNGHFSSTLTPVVEDDMVLLVNVGLDPYTGCVPEKERHFLLPLAAGDLNEDGIGDYVSGYGVHPGKLSDDGLSIEYPDFFSHNGSPWTQALIDDLNADKHLDVLGGSDEAVGLVFLQGSGDIKKPFTPVTIPTQRQTAHFASGYFDGDGVRDVAIAEIIPRDPSAPLNTTGSALSILFGRPFQAPEPPLRMGRLDDIRQIIKGDFSENTKISDAMDDLVVVSAREETTMAMGEKPGTTLKTGVLLFPGNADRQLQSMFRLAFDKQANFVIRTAIGRFAGGDEHADVALLTIGFKLTPGTEPFYTMWLLPTTAEAEFAPPNVSDSPGMPLPPPPYTTQSKPLPDAYLNGMALGASFDAVDLNGDNTDELISFVPQLETRKVFLYSAAALDGAWVLQEPTEYDDLLLNLQVEVVDLDGDSLRDVIGRFLLPDESTGRVVVFWNNGAGLRTDLSRVDVADIFVIPDEGSAPIFPQDFAVLNADTDPEMELAIVTLEGTYLVDSNRDHSLSAPVLIPDLPGGSKVGAGDINGDGIDDLIISDLTDLKVYRGNPLITP